MNDDIDFDELSNASYNALNSKQFNNEPEPASDFIPTPRMIKRQERLRLEHINRYENACQLLQNGMPAQGEAVHVISGGVFDYWDIIPWIINNYGAASELLASTWTMNRECVLSLLNLYDSGKIRSMGIVSGDYFKNRETAVFATLYEGMQQRNQPFACFNNHAKVLLIHIPDVCWFVAEGSANFNANPRLEQFQLMNDKELYNFHKQWIMEALKKKVSNKMSQL
ncbi:hypothetical protein FACS1894184_14800 [Clostridia bacterium]|nr:hypothetical protein FACS1894184_14800 [Clostridia bacterium]